MGGRATFSFKHFIVQQDKCGMKVTTDACVFGALVTRWMLEGRNPHRVLDVGTGTSVLSLMMAQRFPAARIDAVEIDLETAVQARQNASQFDNIAVFHADAARFEPPSGERYDAIVCNPPFFSRSRPSATPKLAVAKHDYHLSAETLAKCVSRLLSPSGTFFVMLSARFHLPRREFEFQAARYRLRPIRAVEFADRVGACPHAVGLAFALCPPSRKRGNSRMQTIDSTFNGKSLQAERLHFFDRPGAGWRPLDPQMKSLMSDFYLDKYL